MAGELLKNSEGLPVPQRLKDGASPSLTGDSAIWEALDGNINLEEGTNHIGNVGKSFAFDEIIFTRPADTTPYAAGDVVSDSTSAPTVLEFENMARNNNGGGVVRKVAMYTDAASDTNADFRLYLFHTLSANQNDNEALALTYNDLENLIGWVDLSLEVIGGIIGYVWTGELPFIAAAVDDSIYGILVATAAYTPASGESITLHLTVERS